MATALRPMDTTNTPPRFERTEVVATPVLTITHGDRVNRLIFEANMITTRGQQPGVRFVRDARGYITGIELAVIEVPS